MDLDGLTDEARQAVDRQLRSGHKIAAIKRVREETGAGLKEAKEAVEAYASSHGITAASGSSGCLVFFFVLGAGLAVVAAI
jgi:hypothetical protein